MKQTLLTTFHTLLDQLLPLTCLSCNSLLSGQSFNPELCSLCKEHTIAIDKPYCNRCGIPFDTPFGNNHTCNECIANKPVFDAVVSLFRYGGSIRSALIAYKFKHRIDAHIFFSKLLFEKAINLCTKWEIDMIAPVPTHKLRILSRGYSHTYLMVYGMKKLGLKLPEFDIKKQRNTAPLWGLNKRNRQTTVKNSFFIRKTAKIKNKNLLLIDDIMTTGATMNECATMLKKSGASKVYGLTVARDII